jgi:hypothetical protein
VEGLCHCPLNPDDLLIITGVGPDGLVGPTSCRRSISDLMGPQVRRISHKTTDS